MEKETIKVRFNKKEIRKKIKCTEGEFQQSPVILLDIPLNHVIKLCFKFRIRMDNILAEFVVLSIEGHEPPKPGERFHRYFLRVSRKLTPI
ncbi:MAG TPA: hypothetical protein VK528_11220 [Flavobacterium sp.]|nr:hypothetical protein [Flavobacterium sp.]